MPSKPPMRRSLRLAVVAAIAVIEIASSIAAVSENGMGVGSYGFIVAKDQVTIASVAHDSPAYRAGIVPGDTLAYARLSLRGRRFASLDEEVPAGAALTVIVTHAGRTRTIVLRAQAVPGIIARVETLTYALAGLTMGLVGLALVLLRPSRMTWAFALIAPPLLFPWSSLFWAQSTQSTAAAAFDILIALLYGLQTTGIMAFASRFPDDRPHGIARAIDALSIPLGAAVALLYVYVYLTVRYTTMPPGQTTLADVAIVLPSAAALIALVSTFLTSPGPIRSRLLPVLGSFVFLVVSALVQQLVGERSAEGVALLAWTIAYSASPALVAAAVAYGVARHRVMDVSFIISRTLVYSILTVSAVATFAIIEYVFGRLLEHQGVATVLEIAAAIGVGLSLNALHRRLDLFIDVVLFRRRHAAEKRLADATRSLPHATTAALVDAVLADEPADALGLASAAVFRRNETHYERVAASGWHDGEAGVLEDDDRLAIQLRAELRPLKLHDYVWPRSDVPSGGRQVLYAIPVLIGHTVEAIALYGGHTGGEDLDPDERRSLRALAQAAAIGYDRIRSEGLRRRLEVVEAENASLRSVEEKLTQLLHRRLS
jgi:hypothetical protein